MLLPHATRALRTSAAAGWTWTWSRPYSTLLVYCCLFTACLMHAASVSSYYRMGADRGDEYAQFYLATCYREGIGVAKSQEQSLHWALVAADGGDADAQCLLY